MDRSHSSGAPRAPLSPLDSLPRRTTSRGRSCRSTAFTGRLGRLWTPALGTFLYLSLMCPLTPKLLQVSPRLPILEMNPLHNPTREPQNGTQTENVPWSVSQDFPQGRSALTLEEPDELVFHAGRNPTLMPLRVKEGVSLHGLRSEIVHALGVALEVFHHVTITSGTEEAEGRVPNSLHRSGHAIDIRWPKPDVMTTDSRQVKINSLIERLGEDYDVVVYPGSHIHVEYDPQ